MKSFGKIRCTLAAPYVCYGDTAHTLPGVSVEQVPVVIRSCIGRRQNKNNMFPIQVAKESDRDLV